MKKFTSKTAKLNKRIIMNKIQYKKLFVLLRKVVRLFYTPEKDFEKEYYNTRIKEAVVEVMHIDVAQRFKFIEEVKAKALQKTIEERDQLEIEIEKINIVLEKL